MFRNNSFPSRSGGFKRRSNTRVVAAVSAVLSVIFLSTAYLAFVVFRDSPAPALAFVQQENTLQTVQVLVPDEEIQAGAPLDKAMFRLQEFPSVAVTSDAIRNFSDIEGMYARAVIVPGQPLIEKQITRVKQINEVTANIPEGFRAVTIRVDDRTSVEGWARPGARVDVVWASIIRGKAGITTIVQNAQVLSAQRTTVNVDPNSEEGQAAMAAAPTTVTLLVSAEDASKIQLASTTGSISLSLRGEKDVDSTASRSLTVEDLIGNSGDDTSKGQPVYSGTVRMPGKNGTMTEYGVTAEGQLVPLESKNS
jgi:pilus assembly protein CpaB